MLVLCLSFTGDTPTLSESQALLSEATESEAAIPTPSHKHKTHIAHKKQDASGILFRCALLTRTAQFISNRNC